MNGGTPGAAGRTRHSSPRGDSHGGATFHPNALTRSDAAAVPRREKRVLRHNGARCDPPLHALGLKSSEEDILSFFAGAIIRAEPGLAAIRGRRRARLARAFAAASPLAAARGCFSAWGLTVRAARCAADGHEVRLRLPRGAAERRASRRAGPATGIGLVPIRTHAGPLHHQARPSARRRRPRAQGYDLGQLSRRRTSPATGLPRGGDRMSGPRPRADGSWRQRPRHSSPPIPATPNCGSSVLTTLLRPPLPASPAER